MTNIKLVFYKILGILFVISGLFSLIFGHIEYQQSLFEIIFSALTILVGQASLFIDINLYKDVYKEIIVNIYSISLMIKFVLQVTIFKFAENISVSQSTLILALMLFVYYILFPLFSAFLLYQNIKRITKKS